MVGTAVVAAAVADVHRCPDDVGKPSGRDAAEVEAKVAGPVAKTVAAKAVDRRRPMGHLQEK